MTFKVIVKGSGGQARLLGAFDRDPGKSNPIEITTFLTPEDSFYTTLQHDDDGKVRTRAVLEAIGGSKNYKGKGIFIRHQQVEGPLNESWPPPSTRQLLGGTNLVSIGDSEVGPFDVELTKKPIEHVREIIGQFAPRAFRRPQTEDELESFVSLAVPTIEEGRDFFDALRIPLRSMLSSPEFMMFDGIGQHDGYALASRLFLLSVEKYARR